MKNKKTNHSATGGSVSDGKDSVAHSDESRPPTAHDLVGLCRRLNEANAKYIVIGGMAVVQHGFVRATEDIDLLVDVSSANQERIRTALMGLPDGAVKDMKPDDLDAYMVVRVADEIVIDLMKSANGIEYTEASSSVEWVEIQGVKIPFADLKLLWRLKQTCPQWLRHRRCRRAVREKDALDRIFLKEKLKKGTKAEGSRHKVGGENAECKMENEENSGHFVPLCLCASVPSSKSGFSLVEISLALLIVAIGMLAILGMFPSGLDQNARSISDTHAALFAEEVFSSLRVHAENNWQAIVSLPAAATNNWDTQVSLDIKLDNEIYTNIYRHLDNTNLIDHAFRYRITLTTNGLIKAAFLRFWPGEFGTTNNPALFYSEFFEMNR